MLHLLHSPLGVKQDEATPGLKQPNVSSICNFLQVGWSMAWSKESRQSRGYGAEWDRIRARVIKRDKGLCQRCLKAGRVTIGREVDHVVQKADAKRMRWTQAQYDADSNLQLLCTPCHSHKTAEDNGRAHKPVVAFGTDGWPLDKPSNSR